MFNCQLEDIPSCNNDIMFHSWQLRLRRIIAHLVTTILLCSSAYAVVLLVVRSMEVDESFSWWRQNELSLIMTLIGQIFPMFFKVRFNSSQLCYHR